MSKMGEQPPGGFVCPFCGGSWFESSVKNGEPQVGYCKGPMQLVPAPGGGYFRHYEGCTFTWDRRHDAAVFRVSEQKGN